MKKPCYFSRRVYNGIHHYPCSFITHDRSRVPRTFSALDLHKRATNGGFYYWRFRDIRALSDGKRYIGWMLPENQPCDRNDQPFDDGYPFVDVTVTRRSKVRASIFVFPTATFVERVIAGKAKRSFYTSTRFITQLRGINFFKQLTFLRQTSIVISNYVCNCNNTVLIVD